VLRPTERANRDVHADGIAPGGNISVSHAVKNLSPAPGNAGLSASRLLSTDQTIVGQVADLGRLTCRRSSRAA
jgi:hypothetical protein